MIDSLILQKTLTYRGRRCLHRRTTFSFSVPQPPDLDSQGIIVNFNVSTLKIQVWLLRLAAKMKLDHSSVKVVLLDIGKLEFLLRDVRDADYVIEGTVCPISFVKDVLVCFRFLIVCIQLFRFLLCMSG